MTPSNNKKQNIASPRDNDIISLAKKCNSFSLCRQQQHTLEIYCVKSAARTHLSLSLCSPCYPPFKVTYFNSLITYLSQETAALILSTLTRTCFGINVDYLTFWYSIRVKPCIMLCVSIMTNAYIIGFMSPRVEQLQQKSSVQSDRSRVFTQRAAEQASK